MVLDKIALALTIIGGLNCGVVGIFRFNVIAYLCGGVATAASRTVFTIIGIAAIWCFSLLFREHGQRERV